MCLCCCGEPCLCEQECGCILFSLPMGERNPLRSLKGCGVFATSSTLGSCSSASFVLAGIPEHTGMFGRKAAAIHPPSGSSRCSSPSLCAPSSSPGRSRTIPPPGTFQIPAVVSSVILPCFCKGQHRQNLAWGGGSAPSCPGGAESSQENRDKASGRERSSSPSAPLPVSDL